MEWVYDDGGRSKYFKGDAGDCVVRAIAIATEQDYKKVYDDLAEMHKARYGTKSARNGTNRDDIKKYMANLGWTWHPTMKIGSGCTTHMRKSELPSGRVMCSLSRHIATVVDGVLHDTYDSTRDGTRCVYGYWTEPPKCFEAKPRGHGNDNRLMREVSDVQDDFINGLITPHEFGQLCEEAAVRWRGW